MNNTATDRIAFDLVNPAAVAASRPGCSPVDADWRDPISTVVTKAALEASGVTIDDIIVAVVNNTATAPKVVDVGLGWLVTADGYRNGPAGP